MNFKDKIVLVSGGTKGIGRSISLEFLKRDATVLAVYSKDDAALKDMNILIPEKYKNNIFYFKGSIADKNFLKKLFQEIKEKFLKIDFLINNAGINKDNLFLEMTENEWMEVFNVNLKGTYLMSFFASKLLKRDKNEDGSCIVNISSISGVYGKAGQVNYSTTKGAILGMTKFFANKYAEDNIRVNSVIPGLIETEFINDMKNDNISEILNFVSKKRLGTPEEIANVVLFLCSKYSSYINGTSIFVDGGFMI